MAVSFHVSGALLVSHEMLRWVINDDPPTFEIVRPHVPVLHVYTEVNGAQMKIAYVILPSGRMGWRTWTSICDVMERVA